MIKIFITKDKEKDKELQSCRLCFDRNSNSYFQKKKKNYVLTKTNFQKKKKSTIIRIIIKNHKQFRRKNKNPSREREREYSQLFCEKNMDYIEEMTPNLYKIK